MAITSTARSQKFRAKMGDDPDFDDVSFREKEKQRIAEIRRRKKEERNRKPDVDRAHKDKEALRKKEYRRKIKMGKSGKLSSIEERNKKLGLRHRRQKERKEKILKEKLLLKVKMFTNENRRLKRKLHCDNENEEVEVEDEEDVLLNSSDLIVQNLSPAPKRRALQRMKINDSIPKDVHKDLRLDRVPLSKVKYSELRQK